MAINCGEVEIVLKPSSDLEKLVFSDMMQGRLEKSMVCTFSIEERGESQHLELTLRQ